MYSEPGLGSSFKVLLPVTSGAAASRAVAPGRGHILVVDDEESVLQFTTEALTRPGYEVSQCSNGPEAVEFFRERHAEIDLVILDLIMPKPFPIHELAKEGARHLSPE